MALTPVFVAVAVGLILQRFSGRAPLRRPTTVDGDLIERRFDRMGEVDRRDRQPSVTAERPHRHRRLRHIGYGIGTGALAALLGPTPATLIVAATLLGRHLLRRRRSHAAEALVEASIPEVLDLLGSLLSAGLTPRQACIELAELGPHPARPPFVQLVAGVAHGQRLGDALRDMGNRHSAFRSLADTLVRSEDYGDPIRPIIDRLAEQARQQRRRLIDASSRRLPVQLCFPLVCCTLPAFVLLTIVPILAGTLSSLRRSF